VFVPYDHRLDKFLAYFEPEVLAPYREQGDKYVIKTDLFDGSVTVRSDYYESQPEDDRREQNLAVRFGYRTLNNGDLKIAAFALDLVEKSSSHIERWRPFLVRDAEWLDYESDERFVQWVERYIEGRRWGGQSPAALLIEELGLINSLTQEAVGLPLYDVEEPEVLFPAAQNTHKYEDAHRAMYGILIDGLNHVCIAALATRLQRIVNTGSNRTVAMLSGLLPILKGNDIFAKPMDAVSKQRGRAAHKVRPPAKPMQAFQLFSTDLDACLGAVQLVRGLLERELGMNAKASKARQEALKWIPTIVRPPEPNYSINRAVQMKGKTVETVQIGFREQYEGAHASEAIIIHFTDGSILSIDTGCNYCGRDFVPGELEVDLMVHWVPPK
jgi:hypothetical protein